MNTKRRPWISRLFMGAIFWVAAKILQPLPVLSALVDIVAFAM